MLYLLIISASVLRIKENWGSITTVGKILQLYTGSFWTVASLMINSIYKNKMIRNTMQNNLTEPMHWQSLHKTELNRTEQKRIYLFPQSSDVYSYRGKISSFYEGDVIRGWEFASSFAAISSPFLKVRLRKLRLYWLHIL